MTGHRRRKGRGLAFAERADRRKQFHLARLAAAEDPLAMAAALNDYLRRMLVLVPPPVAARAIERVKATTLQVIADLSSAEEVSR